MDTQEFIYPFPAKPAGGQVNTFVLFFKTHFFIKSEIFEMYLKKIEQKKKITNSFYIIYLSLSVDQFYNKQYLVLFHQCSTSYTNLVTGQCTDMY